MIEGLITLVISIAVIAAIAGLLVYLIRRAPFIGEPFKSWIEYAIIVIAVLCVILVLLRALNVLGVSI